MTVPDYLPAGPPAVPDVLVALGGAVAEVMAVRQQDVKHDCSPSSGFVRFCGPCVHGGCPAPAREG